MRLPPNRRLAAVGASVLLVLALTACDPPPPSQPWTSEQVVFGEVDGVAFSPDGGTIAFATWASLVPLDGNGRKDVYLRDLATGATTLVSVNGSGTDGGNHDSWGPAFNPDGSTVAFDSYASDLGPTDGNGVVEDVYLRDLGAGTTSLVSLAAGGSGSGDGTSYEPVFSPDGGSVAFTSVASNLVAGDGNAAYDVFVRDLGAGTTSLVSENGAGTGPGSNGSGQPVYSPDGGSIAFTSAAGDLGPVDSNGVDDVYLRDLGSGTNALVSVHVPGAGSAGRSFLPRFAGASRVVFSSEASDLGTVDSDADRDVFVRDLTAGTTTLVSVNGAGTGSTAGGIFDVAVSPDGNLVAFTTNGTDLGPPDSGTDYFDFDVYLRDLGAGTTTMLSVNAAGTDGGDGASSGPLFSPDGTEVAFTSDAQDLGTPTGVCPGPKPGPPPYPPCRELLVRDLRSGITTLASGSSSVADSGHTSGPAFSPTGDRIAYGLFLTGYNAFELRLSTRDGADLSLDLTPPPDPVTVGDTVTYGIAVENRGPDDAPGSRVALLLPVGTAVVAAPSDPACTVSVTEAGEPLVVCELGTLAVGTAVDLVVQVDVADPPGDSLKAVSVAASSEVDWGAGNHIRTVTTAVTP